MFDQAELTFYASERPRLVAQGITDYQEQTDELARRWALVGKAFQPKTSNVVGSAVALKGAVKLPKQLDDVALAASGLELCGVETNATGAVVFVYKKSNTGAGAKPKAPANTGAKPKAPASMPDEEEEEEEEDDSNGDDDDDEMSWPCEVSTERLVKKAKKEHIAALCGDFGIPITGSKAKLAEALAEQLHYETDDEGDDDEGDDDA